jgi:hypothetical protein
MSMTWRPATSSDIEPGLSIQASGCGDGPVGLKAALDAWKYLFRESFFISVALESSPPIHGHTRIGFSAALLVSSRFMDAEVANPQPDVTARIIASVHAGRSVAATRNEVARADAGEGVDIVLLYSAWRHEILSPMERRDIESLSVSSLVQTIAGFRVRRILWVTCQPMTEFALRSAEFRTIGEFPELGRTMHLMTRESGTAMPGSVGNIIFKIQKPLLRLRDSDQNLLLAALKGATDAELATELGITPAAVKARWRSAFARVAKAMPSLVDDVDDREGRGTQKRHRVLAYVRMHPEELRPYNWTAKT